MDELDKIGAALGFEGFVTVTIALLVMALVWRVITPHPERQSSNPEVEYPTVTFINKIGGCFNTIAVIGFIVLLVLALLKNGI